MASSSHASQSPTLQEFCEKILRRARHVQAVLIGTVDGTPVVNALSDSAEDKSFTAHLERELPQHFALAAVQAEKMGMGNLQYTVTFYPQACLVHINLTPLVVTLVHKDGQAAAGHGEPNYGDSLAMIPEISQALEPLRKQVESCRDDSTAAYGR
ncbi:unnamed protein product [Ascophyllum nodosum]